MSTPRAHAAEAGQRSGDVAVRRIVDDQNVEVRIGLSGKACQRQLQALAPVSRADDDSDTGRRDSTTVIDTDVDATDTVDIEAFRDDVAHGGKRQTLVIAHI